MLLPKELTTREAVEERYQEALQRDELYRMVTGG